jgi:hypothetical protein
MGALLRSPVAVVSICLVMSGCTSAIPTDDPGIDQLGKYILRQKGAEVDTLLGYRYAALNLGADWLILEVAFSSPDRQSADIERSKVFVRTPTGVRIPLATQAEFGEAYSGLRATLTKANIARDPLEYFPPNRRPCALQLFTAPGAGVVFDEVSVNDRRACEGKLYFKVPGGVMSGRWVLGIDLEESTVRIPFQL